MTACCALEAATAGLDRLYTSLTDEEPDEQVVLSACDAAIPPLGPIYAEQR